MRNKKMLITATSVVVLCLISLLVWYVVAATISSNKIKSTKNIVKLTIASDFESFAFYRWDNSRSSEPIADINRLIAFLQRRRATGELPGISTSRDKSLEENIADEFWKGTEYLKEYAAPGASEITGEWPTLEGVQHKSDMREKFYASFDRLSELVKDYESKHKKPGFDTQRLWEEERRLYATIFDLAEFDKWWTSE